MSQLLEKLNAEQERIEQAEKVALYKRLDEMQDTINKFHFTPRDIINLSLGKEVVRMQDMHDFIYSNPTLKGNTKELTFQRYLEIYKTNHADEMKIPFDHDRNPETPEVTLNEIFTEKYNLEEGNF